MSLACPVCRGVDTKVVDVMKFPTLVVRKHTCKGCSNTFPSMQSSDVDLLCRALDMLSSPKSVASTQHVDTSTWLSSTELPSTSTGNREVTTERAELPAELPAGYYYNLAGEICCDDAPEPEEPEE